MPLDVHDDLTFQKQVCEWLKANDIDSSRVPVDEVPSIADGQITLRIWVEPRQQDINDPMRLLTKVVTVPLKVPPTGDVAEWVRPKCSECGR